jgi:hypothetical protein
MGNVNDRKNVFKNYCKPTLTCGTETWSWIKANSSSDEVQKEKLEKNDIKNSREFSINALEDNLINNGITWYGHVLKTNEERTPQKASNMKIQGRC